MSTRSQIKVRSNDEYVNSIYIYKHSDGYPEGVLPVLVPFVKAFNESRGCSDGCYLLAQIIRAFAIADYQEELEREPIRNEIVKKVHDTYRFLGWGIDTCEHDDIEYLYEIDENGDIYINGEKQTAEQLSKYYSELP